jgi:hypothetical protein
MERARPLIEEVSGRLRAVESAADEGMFLTEYGGPEEGRLREFTPTESTGAGTRVSLDANAPPPADATGQLLLQHVEDAIARFEIDGFTPEQEQALIDHPELESAYRGERIDEFAKQAVADDPKLSHIIVTPRFFRGADFYDGLMSKWYDITTAKAWKAHVEKYGPEGIRLPTEPARVPRSP